MRSIGSPEAPGNTPSAVGHTNAAKSAGAETFQGLTAVPVGSPEAIAAVHRSLPFPTDDELRWLLDQGIDDDAMALPWPVRGARVRFDRDTFDFDLDGGRALTFRSSDRGETIDLIAWQPQTGKLASWRGVAFCVGDVDDIFNPATYFAGSALHVHKTPLEWLLANRQGIVIVRPDLAHAYLANRQRIVCPDARFAREVEAWVQPPKPIVEIFVAVAERAVA